MDQQYYSEEALERLEEVRQSVSADAIAQAERDWSALIAEVEAAAVRGIDPSATKRKHWRVDGARCCGNSHKGMRRFNAA